METQSLKKGRFLIQEVTEPKPISKKFLCRHDSINLKKQYYFKQAEELDLIEVIIRVAIGKHREWIHNRDIDKLI